MPVVCYFYGISIFFRFSDHNPPHFHAKYGAYEMSVDIGSWIMKGDFPKKAEKMVLEWAEQNEANLLKNWKIAQEHGIVEPIEPLE